MIRSFLQGQSSPPASSYVGGLKNNRHVATLVELLDEAHDGTVLPESCERADRNMSPGVTVSYPTSIELPPDDVEEGDVKTPMPRKHGLDDFRTEFGGGGIGAREGEEGEVHLENRIVPPPLKARRKRERHPQYRIMLPDSVFQGRSIPDVVLQGSGPLPPTPGILLHHTEQNEGGQISDLTIEDVTPTSNDSMALVPWIPPSARDLVFGPRILFRDNSSELMTEEEISAGCPGQRSHAQTRTQTNTDTNNSMAVDLDRSYDTHFVESSDNLPLGLEMVDADITRGRNDQHTLVEGEDTAMDIE